MFSKKCKRPFVIEESEENEFKKSKICNQQDTIGVMCIDRKMNAAFGVSSSGIVLKQSGRVGPAPHFGCGCGVSKYDNDVTVACCTSESGEAVIRTGLAKAISDFVSENITKTSDLNTIVKNKFLCSNVLKNLSWKKHCGVLLFTISPSEDIENEYLIDFQLAHTTQSFCVSYFSPCMKKLECVISRLDSGTSDGEAVVSKEYLFKLKRK